MATVRSSALGMGSEAAYEAAEHEMRKEVAAEEKMEGCCATEDQGWHMAQAAGYTAAAKQGGTAVARAMMEGAATG